MIWLSKIQFVYLGIIKNKGYEGHFYRLRDGKFL